MKNNILLIIANFLFISGVAYSQTTVWADRITGSGDELPRNVVVDDAGNYYVAGQFVSPAITFNNGVTLNQTANVTSFIAKYNSLGVCQWAEVIAGYYDGFVRQIALDDAGNIYLAGSFSSTTLYFNNNIELELNGIINSVIAKYDSLGECQWAEKIGGNDENSIMETYGLAVDNSQNVYIAGGFFTNDKIYFNEGISLDGTNNMDGFFTKYNSFGECQWAKSISGTSYNRLLGIGLDGGQDIYLIGKSFLGEIYFDENNSLNIDLNSGFDYLVKFNSNLNFQWVKLLSNVDDNVDVFQVALDGGGDVYVGASADTGPFIVKYSSLGDFLWKENITGDKYKYATTMTVMPPGDFYIGGYFNSLLLDFNNNVTLERDSTLEGLYGFLAKYNRSGECQWAEKITGNNENIVQGIAVDYDENIYVTGYYGADKLFFNNNFSLELVSNYDGFIAKYIPGVVTLPIVSGPVQTSKVTSESAISGGAVIADGGAEVSERGVCISTSLYPDINDTKIVANETGLGSFTVQITNLQPATKCYVRVYAINIAGVGYSEVRSFTTAPSN